MKKQWYFGNYNNERVYTDAEVTVMVNNGHGFVTDDDFWPVGEYETKEQAQAVFAQSISSGRFDEIAEADHP